MEVKTPSKIFSIYMLSLKGRCTSTCTSGMCITKTLFPTLMRLPCWCAVIRNKFWFCLNHQTFYLWIQWGQSELYMNLTGGASMLLRTMALEFHTVCRNEAALGYQLKKLWVQRDGYSPGMHLSVNFHPFKTLYSPLPKYDLCRRDVFCLELRTPPQVSSLPI